MDFSRKKIVSVLICSAICLTVEGNKLRKYLQDLFKVMLRMYYKCANCSWIHHFNILYDDKTGLAYLLRIDVHNF